MINSQNRKIKRSAETLEIIQTENQNNQTSPSGRPKTCVREIARTGPKPPGWRQRCSQKRANEILDRTATPNTQPYLPLVGRACPRLDRGSKRRSRFGWGAKLSKRNIGARRDAEPRRKTQQTKYWATRNRMAPTQKTTNEILAQGEIRSTRANSSKRNIGRSSRLEPTSPSRGEPAPDLIGGQSAGRRFGWGALSRCRA